MRKRIALVVTVLGALAPSTGLLVPIPCKPVFGHTTIGCPIPW